MKNHHGGVVLVDGYLYGFNDSILTCLEFATGKLMWRDRSVGKGSVTYADGHLYIQSENNMVGLAEATPSGYREKGRFEIPDKGHAELGAPGDQRRPPLRAQSGHAARVRHQGRGALTSPLDDSDARRLQPAPQVEQVLLQDESPSVRRAGMCCRFVVASPLDVSGKCRYSPKRLRS